VRARMYWRLGWVFMAGQGGYGKTAQRRFSVKKEERIQAT